MEFTIYHIMAILLFVVLCNIVTFVVLYFTISPRGQRKPPLEVMERTTKIFYLLYLKARRRAFWLHEIENKWLWCLDWERGLWYGYSADAPKLGDQVYVKTGKTGEFMLLVVVRLHRPSTADSNIFLCKTYYLGKRRHGQPEELDSKSRSFQSAI